MIYFSLLLIFIIYILLLCNANENFVSSEEAIQNLSSMYNSKIVTSSNINILNNLNVGQELNGNNIYAKNIIVSEEGNINNIATSSLKIQPKCQYRQTLNYSSPVNGWDYMNRFPVVCNDDEFLQGWNWTCNSPNPFGKPGCQNGIWSMQYKCCKLDNSPFASPASSEAQQYVNLLSNGSTVAIANDYLGDGSSSS